MWSQASNREVLHIRTLKSNANLATLADFIWGIRELARSQQVVSLMARIVDVRLQTYYAYN